MTGDSAARNPWRRTMIRSRRPLPRAVRTKSSVEDLCQRGAGHPVDHRRQRRSQDEPRHPQRLQPAQRTVGERDVAAVPGQERDLQQVARLRGNQHEHDRGEPVHGHAHPDGAAHGERPVGGAATVRPPDEAGCETDGHAADERADQQRDVDGHRVEQDLAARLVELRGVAEVQVQERVRQVARQLRGLVGDRHALTQRAEEHEGQRRRDQHDNRTRRATRRATYAPNDVPVPLRGREATSTELTIV